MIQLDGGGEEDDVVVAANEALRRLLQRLQVIGHFPAIQTDGGYGNAERFERGVQFARPAGRTPDGDAPLRPGSHRRDHFLPGIGFGNRKRDGNLQGSQDGDGLGSAGDDNGALQTAVSLSTGIWVIARSRRKARPTPVMMTTRSNSPASNCSTKRTATAESSTARSFTEGATKKERRPGEG